VIINAANEVAIEKFIAKEIGFMDISKTILNTYEKFYDFKAQSVDDIFAVDKEIRETI
jgi:1-deoxy-D-xylulose-5-phosphate reductoisomerase